MTYILGQLFDLKRLIF